MASTVDAGVTTRAAVRRWEDVEVDALQIKELRGNENGG